jgi:tetratricopeptide (TPR) repeat protein
MPAIPPEKALPLIQPAAETALQLDPLLAEAHAAMGLLYSRKLDWKKAEESFQRAIDLNPSLTHIYATYSMSTLMPLGRVTEAEQALRTALQRDPLSLSLQMDLAWLQFKTGRFEEAVDGLERIRTVDPHFSTVDNRLARALTFAGRPADALRVLEAKKAQPGVQHWLARAYVLTGQRAEVERLAATHDHPYRLAVIYAALGDRDRAFDALDRAALIVPNRVARLLTDPEMAALRGDPRFAAVRTKVGLP